MDHVSMHTTGTKSSEEGRQSCNRDLVATIEDLQRSQATMWANFQSFRQRTSTLQTPQGSQGPQGETERSNLVPTQNQDPLLNEKAPP